MIANGNMPLYYHMNRLDSGILLTSGLTGEEASSARYDEWGDVDADLIECSGYELDMVRRYATHDYDAVLDLYYAKARMYDNEDRRFLAVDPILDGAKYNLKSYITNPMMLVQYLYVLDNPLKYVDCLGESIGELVLEKTAKSVPALLPKCAAPIIKKIFLGGFGVWFITFKVKKSDKLISIKNHILVTDSGEIIYVEEGILNEDMTPQEEQLALQQFINANEIELASTPEDINSIAQEEQLALNQSLNADTAHSTLDSTNDYYDKPICEAEVVLDVGGIAGQYGDFKCVEASNAIAEYLKKISSMAVLS